MTVCTHCQRLDEEHVSLKCLFSPTEFAPMLCASCKETFHVYLPNPMAKDDLNIRLALWLDDDGKYRHGSCLYRDFY
jgi:hypothetical protein